MNSVGHPRLRNAVRSCAFALILLVAFEKPAAAYADPGTGALLWQMLAAGFVGVIFYFRRITAWFKRKGKDE